MCTRPVGHRLAWEKAGVLHRDVSLGNHDEDSDKSPFVGFIHDFDYSAMVDLPPEVEDDLPLSEEPEDAVPDGMENIAVAFIKDDLRKEHTVRNSSHLSRSILTYLCRERIISWPLRY